MFFIILLAALAFDPVGKWSASGSAGNMGWTAHYEFKADGSFTMDGYPAIHVEGKWQITERAGGKVKLKLTNQKMNIPPDKTQSDWADVHEWATISDNGKTMIFNGKNLRKD
jgi:hypothetical protein